jgi:hypothetical protein
MKSSETIASLAAALAKAQAEFKAVQFDADNPHFKSKFASLPATVEAVRPILAKHGLAVVQGATLPDSNEGVVTGFAVESILIHTSGEWLSTVVYVPMEKPTAQGAGSGLTYGRRYGLQALLCLVADDDDGETASNHPQTPRPAATRPVAGQTPPKAATPSSDAVRGKVMPFGRNKGVPLTEMSDPDLTSALDWCSDSGEKREKFKDLIADLQAEQKARTLVRPGKDAPPPPSDDDSQLPF